LKKEIIMNALPEVYQEDNNFGPEPINYINHEEEIIKYLQSEN